MDNQQSDMATSKTRPGVRRNQGAWEAVYRDENGKVTWACGHVHQYRDRSYYGLRGEQSAWACAYEHANAQCVVVGCSGECSH